MEYKIIKLEKHNDYRGNLVVFLRNKDLKKKKTFGQIYFVTFEKNGVVRGNHYHKKWREWFGIVSGKVKVVLKDIATGETKNITLDGNKDPYIRLEIGPKIAHAFKNISENASLLNYTNLEWSSTDTYYHKLI